MPFLFLGILLVILFVIRGRMNYANRNYGSKVGEFLEAEREANEARRRDIPEELFYRPDVSAFSLPRVALGGSEDAADKLRESILALAKTPMLRFGPGMTNRELKLTYGAANIDFIAECEENFNDFVNRLHEYSAALYAAGMLDDAETNMLECVRAGTGAAAPYRLIADVCAEKRDAEGFESLREAAEDADMEMLIKNRILEYIDSKKINGAE